MRITSPGSKAEAPTVNPERGSCDEPRRLGRREEQHRIGNVLRLGGIARGGGGDGASANNKRYAAQTSTRQTYLSESPNSCSQRVRGVSRALEEALVGLIGKSAALLQFGNDHTGIDSVHADALGCEVNGRAHRHRVDCGLGRAVRETATKGLLSARVQ